MAQLVVIHMITYSHMLPVDHLVSDIRIVWVNIEPNVCKTLWEITVVQKAYKNCAVHCVLALYQQLCDKRHVLFIFYSRLDKHVQDIDYSDIPLLLFINNA